MIWLPVHTDRAGIILFGSPPYMLSLGTAFNDFYFFLTQPFLTSTFPQYTYIYITFISLLAYASFQIQLAPYSIFFAWPVYMLCTKLLFWLFTHTRIPSYQLPRLPFETMFTSTSICLNCIMALFMMSLWYEPVHLKSTYYTDYGRIRRYSDSD